LSPLQHPHRVAFARMFGLQTATEAEGGCVSERGGYRMGQNDPPSRGGGVALHGIYQDLVVAALRRGEPLSLALLGFDGWQTVARLYGWGVVEQTMTEITRVLLTTFRGSDVVARWREDEIAVLLPRTDAAGGARAVEKAIRALAASGVLQFAEGWVEVGVSAGVASVVPGAPFADVIDETAGQLHAARRLGPGRVRWDGGEVIALGGRISVVDPHDELAGCSELFLRLGGVVTRAQDVEAALQDGASGFALIVLVLDAETGGFADLQRLRQETLLQDTPIVVVGSHSDELPIAFELGADDFLTRPVATMELAARVRRLLGRRSLHPPPNPDGSG
jgi:diguanylate cyclase (GGDEF)-like protein